MVDGFLSMSTMFVTLVIAMCVIVPLLVPVNAVACAGARPVRISTAESGPTRVEEGPARRVRSRSGLETLPFAQASPRRWAR